MHKTGAVQNSVVGLELAETDLPGHPARRAARTPPEKQFDNPHLPHSGGSQKGGFQKGGFLEDRNWETDFFTSTGAGASGRSTGKNQYW